MPPVRDLALLPIDTADEIDVPLLRFGVPTSNRNFVGDGPISDPIAELSSAPFILRIIAIILSASWLSTTTDELRRFDRDTPASLAVFTTAEPKSIIISHPSPSLIRILGHSIDISTSILLWSSTPYSAFARSPRFPSASELTYASDRSFQKSATFGRPDNCFAIAWRFRIHFESGVRYTSTEFMKSTTSMSQADGADGYLVIATCKNGLSSVDCSGFAILFPGSTLVA
mmetsp:Transcript_7083/g.16548  ORF Transcript_7083/g.16548 Transcript_7083/m.16548 type:complete len:229 (-) Transcript_7083:75-761(-)